MLRGFNCSSLNDLCKLIQRGSTSVTSYLVRERSEHGAVNLGASLLFAVASVGTLAGGSTEGSRCVLALTIRWKHARASLHPHPAGSPLEVRCSSTDGGRPASAPSLPSKVKPLSSPHPVCRASVFLHTLRHPGLRPPALPFCPVATNGQARNGSLNPAT